MRFREFFNDIAADYDARVAPCRVLQVKALVFELQLSGRERVLDIGCGSGLLSQEVLRFLTKGGYMTGIDMSRPMLEICRRKLTSAGFRNFDIREGNSLALDFPDDSFDVIVSSNVLPFVDEQDKFIAEVRRVLRPGGRFGLISLHTEVYKEIYKVIHDVRTSYPDLFGQKTVHEDIGVRLEGMMDHFRRLESNGLAVRRSYVMETVEPTTAQEYLERFNASTGEMYLASTPGDKKDFIRGVLRGELEKRNGSLTVTEAVNLLVAHRAA
jgi:ubiquinone/menaquinone biosynthesis C-methylase UbiE